MLTPCAPRALPDRSGLNQIPLIEWFRRHPDDLSCLEVAVGAMSGQLANIDASGANRNRNPNPNPNPSPSPNPSPNPNPNPNPNPKVLHVASALTPTLTLIQPQP